MGDDDLLDALADPPPLRSAGVMPVAVSPSGETYCLLGKEDCSGQWRGSRRWAAFSGGLDAGETDAAGAAREFVEESLGCVAVTCGPHEWQTPAPVQGLLEGGAALRAQLWRLNGASGTCLYVLPVPWQPFAPARFSATRALTESLANSFGVARGDGAWLGHPALVPHPSGAVTVRPCFLEKRMISWFSLAALQSVVDSNGLLAGGLCGTQYFRSDIVPLLSVLLPHLRGDGDGGSEGMVVVRPWR